MIWIITLLRERVKPWLRAVGQSGLGLTLIPFVILIAIGTVAYTWLEGWSWFDSLYATVITITTVGYGDLSPQTPGGRIFAVFFTLGAIGLASYAISTLAALVIDWETNRVQRRTQERRMKQIEDLQNHIILCGGSNIGRMSALFFQRAEQPIIIVEQDEEKLRRALLYLDMEYLKKKFGRYHDIANAVDVTEDEQLSLEELTERVPIPYLLADPTDDSTLIAAGIERARGIVAALESDERNLFAVVSARALATRLDNVKLRVVTLVHDDKNGTKLQVSGADQLVFPEKGSGQQIQTFMMNPLLADFWKDISYMDGSHEIQQQVVAEKRDWIGQTVAELQKQQVLVMAVQRNGRFFHAPAANEKLQANDMLVVFGPKTVGTAV